MDLGECCVHIGRTLGDIGFLWQSKGSLLVCYGCPLRKLVRSLPPILGSVGAVLGAQGM